jgi:hypothetical protein
MRFFKRFHRSIPLLVFLVSIKTGRIIAPHAAQSQARVLGDESGPMPAAMSFLLLPDGPAIPCMTG